MIQVIHRALDILELLGNEPQTRPDRFRIAGKTGNVNGGNERIQFSLHVFSNYPVRHTTHLLCS